MPAEGTAALRLDPDALTASLERLAALEPSLGVDEAVGRVIAAVAPVFGITGCGLMFLDDANAMRYVAASNEGGRVLEVAQEELGYGPCIDALVHDRVVVSSDVVDDARWEGLGPIVAPHGVRAVLGVPVHVGGSAVGSLDVYYDVPHAWEDGEVAALLAYNHVLEGLLAGGVLLHRQGELVAQLEYALDNRVMIERAVGLLMGRHGLDAVAAFNQLRTVARSTRRKVGEVASELLDAFEADRA